MTRGVVGDRPLVDAEYTLAELQALPPSKRPPALVRWVGAARDDRQAMVGLVELLDNGVPLPPVFLRPGGKEPLSRTYPGVLGLLVFERWGEVGLLDDPAWYAEMGQRRVRLYELTPAEVRHLARLLR